MASQTLTFQQPARRVYTAVKHVFQTSKQFDHVECDDEHFAITASHGWRFIPTGEDIHIRVLANSSTETEVVIKSSAKIFLNILAIPQNHENVQTLSDYIRNRVNRLCSDEEIKLNL